MDILHGYIVPGASHPLVTVSAWPSRKPLTAQRVLSNLLVCKTVQLATYVSHTAVYGLNLPQRKEALIQWSEYLENLLQDNVIPITLNKCF